MAASSGSTNPGFSSSSATAARDGGAGLHRVTLRVDPALSHPDRAFDEPRMSPSDLKSRIADAAQQAVETWMKRGLQGTVQAGTQELPATIAASILSAEFLVHAWDFASATGQKVAVSDEVATYVLSLAQQVVTPEQRERAGFYPAIPISGDAPALDRLVAFTGRAA